MNREKYLETTLVISLGLLLVYYIAGNRYLLPAVIIIAGSGLLSARIAEKIHEAWMMLANIMGFVMSKVILTVVFFLLLFPIAVLARMFLKNDPLKLKKNTERSYYSMRNHQFTKDDLENPW